MTLASNDFVQLHVSTGGSSRVPIAVGGVPRLAHAYSLAIRVAFFSDVNSNLNVIVCGHTHRPYDKTVSEVRFIKDGSAGKPKDGDPRAC